MGRGFYLGVIVFLLLWGPGEGMPAEQPPEASSNLGVWLVSLFSETVSAVDGDRCPSLPTCSAYSRAAFRKHGLLMGWIMTVDRLMHEADEAKVSPLVRDGGTLKILDPVENNDFWWVAP